MIVEGRAEVGYIESCATVLGVDSPVTLRAVRQYLGQTVRLH